jgi:nucleoid-associated protein YgaU
MGFRGMENPRIRKELFMDRRNKDDFRRRQMEEDDSFMGKMVSGRPASADGQPQMMAEHTVEAGETLSHIALKYYNSAVKDKWMLIYEANKALIGDDPNLLRVGLVLKIPALEE